MGSRAAITHAAHPRVQARERNKSRETARAGVGCMTRPAVDIKDRSFETEKRCTTCKMNIVWIRSDAKMASTYRIVQWPGKRRCARPRVGRACMHRSLSVSRSRSVGRWLPRPPRSLAGRGSNPLCMSLKDTRRVSSLVVSSMRDVQVVRRSTFESSHSHRPLSSIPRRVHGHMF